MNAILEEPEKENTVNTQLGAPEQPRFSVNQDP